MASKKKIKWIRWRQRQKEPKMRGWCGWILKEKAQREYPIRQQELELQRKEQEARARQQELQIELPRKETEQQVQISQVLMTMMQNLVKK